MAIVVLFLYYLVVSCGVVLIFGVGRDLIRFGTCEKRIGKCEEKILAMFETELPLRRRWRCNFVQQCPL